MSKIARQQAVTNRLSHRRVVICHGPIRIKKLKKIAEIIACPLGKLIVVSCVQVYSGLALLVMDLRLRDTANPAPIAKESTSAEEIVCLYHINATRANEIRKSESGLPSMVMSFINLVRNGV